MKLIYPIDTELSVPEMGPGSFGFRRKYDVHTGIDLYCKEGTIVRNIQHGVVTKVCHFTGKSVGSPWWNDTFAVVVDGGGYKLLYGEVYPYVKEGDILKPGEIIGAVKTVLKKDKGLPMTMLHLEMYERSYIGDGVIWDLNSEKPEELLDPTELLIEIFKLNGKRHTEETRDIHRS